MGMFDDDKLNVDDFARRYDLSPDLIRRYISLGIHPEWLWFPGSREPLFDPIAFENILIELGLSCEPFDGFPEDAA